MYTHQETEQLQIQDSTNKMDISITIPVYNEIESIEELIKKITSVLDATQAQYEIIIVDDGSQDGTTGLLEKLTQQYAPLKAVVFSRNYGQTAAMSAGFNYAKGDIIVAMDGDLQNDPADIIMLITKLYEGYDIVTGWRKNRKDNYLLNNLPSHIANWLIGKLTGVQLHDYGCSLKVYTKEIAKSLSLYGEMHRFIPALASIEGAKIIEVPVKHHPRQYGQSKYNVLKTFKVILDLLTVVFLKKFITRPLHFFGRIGMVSFGIGFMICLYLACEKIMFAAKIGDRPLLLLGVLLILTGIQLVSSGIISEIQIRTYYESQNKPIYRVKKIYE